MKYLKSLYLRNFRNFSEREVFFSPKINQIWGNNGQGKTNLLEAIYLLSLGRSFRTLHLPELILEGKEGFYLEGVYEDEGVLSKISLSFNKKKKQLQIDGASYNTFQPLLGLAPLILLTPQDHQIIDGSPALRRRLLNLHLAQCDPLYVHHLMRFWRAMKQRNCLLKLKKDVSIASWEEEMASSALYLLEQRIKLIQELSAPLASCSATISNKTETHRIEFNPSYSEEYKQELSKYRKREFELGLTLKGPHRDELTFWIGEKLARLFGSEGQKKTAIAALKIAEWQRFAKNGAFPLFAIDDLGLPLDPIRQGLFYEILNSLSQVFITSPTPLSAFSSHLIKIDRASCKTLAPGKIEDFEPD